jgi:hypothetical protein
MESGFSATKYTNSAELMGANISFAPHLEHVKDKIYADSFCKFANHLNRWLK